MATIIGGVTTSHIPAIGNAIARKTFDDPYWKPFFDAYPPVHRWLADNRPDVVVVFHNDHGLNFFLDKMPTFAIGAAFDYANADEGWGIPTIPPFAGDPRLSWHIIEGVVAEEFDVTTCQEMLVDHGFTVPMQLLFPNRLELGIRAVPIVFNTVQHPVPSPARAYRFGQAIGRAIRSYPEDCKVALLGTGGLSHQLDGERAGFINKAFDLMCMDKIVTDPEALIGYSALDLVREAGAQGIELIMWLAMRGALGDEVVKLHSNYHIPISNTGAGLLLLEPAA